MRRDCLKQYAEKISVKLVLDNAYGLDEFICNVNACKNNLDKRCETYCYPLRLRRFCEYAVQNGYDTISTTLLYSIYQKHDYIKQLLSELAEEYGLTFLYRDFREGWKEGQDEARAIRLYMQKYCGCVYSEEEAFIGRELSRKFKKAGVSPTNANVRKVIERSKNAGVVYPGDIAPF